MILFRVSDDNGAVVYTPSLDREHAKRAANPFLAGDKEEFTVEPLTQNEEWIEIVHLPSRIEALNSTNRVTYEQVM